MIKLSLTALILTMMENGMGLRESIAAALPANFELYCPYCRSWEVAGHICPERRTK